MKKLVAMVFFAALAGNAMAQAGVRLAAGAARWRGCCQAGATAGTIAVVAVGVAGAAAAASNQAAQIHQPLRLSKEQLLNPARVSLAGFAVFEAYADC